jgi:phosphotransferase family enzyme
VRQISLPEVPYGATAVRPAWPDLPESLRQAISARLGAPVVTAHSAGGGFTRAFAALLSTSAGLSAFVKAAPLNDPTADWYAREAAITSALPVAVDAARPSWTIVDSGYFVLCLEAIDGQVPSLPWAPAELDAALSAWATAANALARPSAALLAVGVPPLPEILRAEMSWWTEIAAGREPMPRTARTTVAPDHLHELAALERDLPRLAAGPGLLHGDLRLDNVLIDRHGQAKICDWTWPCLGAPWFDAVTLLVSAFASGLDADARLARWDAPPDGIDGALAALAGYWLVRAAGGPSSASPHSRQHQRFSGEQALAWLADRRGWAGRFGG